MIRTIWTLILMSCLALPALANGFIILQSTTSTENSGLLEAILPEFTEKTGIEVRVVAVGTGQAIRNAASGNGDVLLVHAKEAEKAFVAEGHGVERFDVMYNDFVLIGPPGDPAGIASAETASQALAMIAASGATFVSRGDDSGTHKAELRLWNKAETNPQSASGTWYLETGSGMGATLNVAGELNAYTMSDRATWISFARKMDLQVLFDGDPALFNQYGVIAVNPDRHPGVKAEAAQALVDWLTSDEGQGAIANFRRDGQQLFFPNARR